MPKSEKTLGGDRIFWRGRRGAHGIFIFRYPKRTRGSDALQKAVEPMRAFMLVWLRR
jgi:hypothetical protein